MKMRKKHIFSVILSICMMMTFFGGLNIYAEEPDGSEDNKSEQENPEENSPDEQGEEPYETAEGTDRQETEEEPIIENTDDSQEEIVYRTNTWTEDHSQYIIDEENGIFASGLTEIDGQYYYFDPGNENRIITDTQKKIDGFWYYFNGEGRMVTGFYYISAQDKTVYYNPDGQMQYGEQKLIGNDDQYHWFYFNINTGKMVQKKFQYIDSAKKTCYYDQNGYMVYGQKKIDGYWYYFDLNSGRMIVSDFQNIPDQNKTCYYNGSGHMVYGQKKINGYWYYFNTKTGRMIVSDFQNIPDQNKTCYYDGSGHMVHGQKKINGYWYYFLENSGAMVTGWKEISSQNKTVYYAKDGKMVHGEYTISGVRHSFKMTNGAWEIEKWLKRVSKPYYIKVNRAANTVTVYAKNYNGKYSVAYKAMICSTGTETPLGKYNTFGRSRWRALYGGVYGQYATDIVGDILFHSVPYAATRVDSLFYWKYNQLGTAASMGCVRLTVADAKWIYDNCPIGTTVEFYDNAKNPGPLGKPKAKKLSNNAKGYWDPTDPAKGNPWNS